MIKRLKVHTIAFLNSDLSFHNCAGLDGTAVWMELLFGWNCCLDGTAVWMELLFGWYCCLDGTAVWMELLFGWNCCLDGTAVWMELLFHPNLDTRRSPTYSDIHQMSY